MLLYNIFIINIIFQFIYPFLSFYISLKLYWYFITCLFLILFIINIAHSSTLCLPIFYVKRKPCSLSNSLTAATVIIDFTCVLTLSLSLSLSLFYYIFFKALLSEDGSSLSLSDLFSFLLIFTQHT